jgi:alginate O-acetyltransferase complex protein AlgI
MLFNSFSFAIFLPLVFLLYWFAFNRNLKWQNLFLLVASYFFYGSWDWRFLFLLASSTALDYLFGFGVAASNTQRAKTYLWFSIISNLGILAIFKYYNFFAVELQQAFDQIGIQVSPVFLDVALPIGISFYTFHGMSYVFDIYHGLRRPATSIVDYGLFVSFFPLLVAGPIERANHLLPQIQRSREFNYSQAVEGCRLILWGLFKKVVIADNLASYVDTGFADYMHRDGFSLIIAIVAFGFQIYADFSGYSDIAIGVSKLLGFEVVSNFRFPYFSRNIAEFWRRWNISLSSWFRDYVYIPLGGSQRGRTRTILITLLVFLLSGFWHGAAWKFLAWGFIHACGFIPYLITRTNSKYRLDRAAGQRNLPGFHDLWRMLTTYAFVSFAWIFFRADDIGSACGYIRVMVCSIWNNPGQFFHRPFGMTAVFYIIPLVAADWWFRGDERRLKFSKWRGINYLLYIILVLCIVLFYRNKGYSFIYFQF